MFKSFSSVPAWAGRVVLAASAIWGLIVVAHAGELDQPHISDRDSWVYHIKITKGGDIKEMDSELSVLRTDGDEILLSTKIVGSPEAPREQMVKADWSRFRSINGVETVVNRPFAFPLTVGKNWRIDYTENNPSPQHLRERMEIPYRVTGWEDVTTRAGSFKALRIEAKGVWRALLPQKTLANSSVVQNNGQRMVLTQQAVQGAREAEGKLYKVFWYVPQEKRWVKSLEEMYSSNGELTEREESELTAFHTDDLPDSGGRDKDKPQDKQDGGGGKSQI
jgi:hypothetical protein